MFGAETLDDRVQLTGDGAGQNAYRRISPRTRMTTSMMSFAHRTGFQTASAGSSSCPDESRIKQDRREQESYRPLLFFYAFGKPVRTQQVLGTPEPENTGRHTPSLPVSGSQPQHAPLAKVHSAKPANLPLYPPVPHKTKPAASPGHLNDSCYLGRRIRGLRWQSKWVCGLEQFVGASGWGWSGILPELPFFLAQPALFESNEPRK